MPAVDAFYYPRLYPISTELLACEATNNHIDRYDRYFTTMKIFRSALSCLLPVILITSCVHSRNAVVISPVEGVWQPNWNHDELSKDLAIRNLRFTSETSHHIIRLKTSERPHVHRNHDLTVFVLKGKAIMHLNDRNIVVNAGDVIEIPRGFVHWAENLDRTGSHVYAIFNPPYDGKDHHPVAPSVKQSN